MSLGFWVFWVLGVEGLQGFVSSEADLALELVLIIWRFYIGFFMFFFKGFV